MTKSNEFIIHCQGPGMKYVRDALVVIDQLSGNGYSLEEIAEIAEIIKAVSRAGVNDQSI